MSKLNNKMKRLSKIDANIKSNKSLVDLNKLHETDEMKLKILGDTTKGVITSDIMYPEELNRQYVEQIKVLSNENAELRKVIITRDQEIKEMCKTVDGLKQRICDILSATGPTISTKSAGIISAKIADLCKQNRHLVAEVESYKTKCSKFERKLQQAEIMKKEFDKLDLCRCKDEELPPTNVDEMKELRDKLHSMTKKLNDSLSKNLVLKNEIQLATKVLQQEVGDKFSSIKDMVSDVGGWKGRAQQVILLQEKVKDLEEKLNIRGKDYLEEKKKEAQSQMFRELENKRKRESEQAIKDLQGLKDENVELKRKLEGARARIRVLECDVTNYRQKLQTCVDKSHNDDVLIDEQRKQLKSLEQYYLELLQEAQKQIDKARKERDEARLDLSNAIYKIDSFQKQVADGAVKIAHLQGHIRKFETGALNSLFFDPINSVRDAEIKKLSDIVHTMNERLVHERKRYEDLMQSNRNLRYSRLVLKKQVSKLELELNALKDKSRSRTISMTGNRTQSVVQHLSNLSTIKPNSITSNSNASVHESSSEEKLCNDYSTILDREDMRNRLEIADERLKMMEDKLKMLEEEKSEDLKYFTDLIQSSKLLFKEATEILDEYKCHCVDIDSNHYVSPDENFNEI